MFLCWVLEVNYPLSEAKGLHYQFFTENCIHAYQLGMVGIDIVNQIREKGVSFCRRAYFHKWCKKLSVTICNFMLLNSYIAWNMVVDERYSKKKILRKYDFYAGLAEEMTYFTAP